MHVAPLLSPQRTVQLTVRLNYIHWLEDLLDLVAPQVKDNAATVKGIDIGTGASCIYALLGAKMNKWQFVATEVADESVKSAKANVERNGLSASIDVRQVKPTTFLQAALTPSDGKFDFCMCNPPFFETIADVRCCLRRCVASSPRAR